MWRARTVTLPVVLVIEPVTDVVTDVSSSAVAVRIPSAPTSAMLMPDACESAAVVTFDSTSTFPLAVIEPPTDVVTLGDVLAVVVASPAAAPSA